MKPGTRLAVRMARVQRAARVVRRDLRTAAPRASLAELSRALSTVSLRAPCGEPSPFLDTFLSAQTRLRVD